MNKIAALSLAALISGSSIAGAAHAQSASETAPVSEDVSIVYLPPDSDDASDSGVPSNIRNASADMIAEAQSELSADPDLYATLQARDVQTNNVVAITSAGNGDRIVYVR